MTFRVVRTNQYNQDLRLIHSTNGNHLESSNEGSSIDHQVTIYLHAQNITMFPTNETWVNFDSVLEIQDNEGMVQMFRALEDTGLRGFLGCPSVLYEQELEQFFDTDMVQDGDITCAVSGKFVAIYEGLQVSSICILMV
ncbi:hypothetical protein F511_32151 [Dorcoceras hygrometricum]|uniref:Uncharacterized protein n=1 Tax=Dorcoceras hygrometricum TaxID=472368 RepID=A0A2Z7CMJ9_9LAMI|nr:hypothetical protein F511_32151 [Dorcoceras hygrometricum]